MRVPDVQYKSLEDAQSILQQAGLTVAVEYEKNNTVAKDHVIRQSLVAGSEVEPQTTITIYISKGNPNVNNNSTAVADNRGSRTTDRGTEGGKSTKGSTSTRANTSTRDASTSTRRPGSETTSTREPSTGTTEAPPKPDDPEKER